MSDQRTLLAEYAANGCEQSFRELVARYVNLVYSVALRLVNRDTHRAEDVTQIVFADLARLAGTLSPDVMLGGWLHRRTCHVAATMMRNERRRHTRENEAALMNALQDPQETRFDEVLPLLDQAINQLSVSDRAAIILRFFERRDFRCVAQALATSEDAAQKRVARALEKLRVMLQRRGAILSGAGLVTLLTAHAVTAAPAGLGAGIAMAALAGAASGGGLAVSLLRLMVTAKFKLAATALLIAGLGTSVILQQQSQDRLRAQAQGLQAEVAAFQDLRIEHERLAALASRPATPEPPMAELARLRDQAAQLRQVQRQWTAQNGTSASAGFHPKGSFSFAGFSDPDSALQSLLWAATSGNVKTMLESLPPDALQQALSSKTADQVAAAVMKHANEVSGYRIVHHEVLDTDRMATWVYYHWADGAGGQLEKVLLRRIGSDWKYAGHEPERLPFQVGVARIKHPPQDPNDP